MAGTSSKVMIQFQRVGEAALLPDKFRKVKVEASKPFSAVADFLRKKLPDMEQQNLFIYIREAFCPSLDEEVGVLSQAYGLGDGTLLVSYAYTPKYG